MPSKGIVEMTTAPRNRPRRNSSLRMGVLKMIWCMLWENSRVAAEFTKAVTISKVMAHMVE